LFTELARNVVSLRPAMRPNFRATDRTLIIRSFTTVSLGVVAKVLGLANQVISVALISSALGAEGLQEQMLAIAFVSWFSLTLCGMHTALPILLIRSGTNSEAFASIAKTAYLLAVLGVSGAVGLTALILNFKLIDGLATAPIATATICNAAVLVFSLSERVFQATDRIAQFNVLNLTGTLVSLAATVFLARTHGTAAGFVMTFYLGMLFPFVVATFAAVPRLNVTMKLSLREFGTSARRLIGTGIFAFGYELAAYCKLQAPLALLSALGFSSEIAPIGLGLRLIGLISGGLSIVVPILLLRIGTAIHTRDQDARRLWSGLGIACAVAVAATAAGLFSILGETIYRTWTGGAVTLDRPEQVTLAIFAALSLAQNLLFPLTAPDPAIAGKLRWLFWLEGPAVLAAGTAGALAAPTAYGGAGMLAGIALVMGGIIIILLVFLAKSMFQKT
jgi:hypothetical protein